LLDRPLIFCRSPSHARHNRGTSTRQRSHLLGP
jgi:hypothetical protein